MPELKGALIGCGYFAKNHLHAWREVAGAEIVAVCDLDRSRAEAYAKEFGIPVLYTAPGEMLEKEPLDFVDIATQPHTHEALVTLAAEHKLHVICQKPLAPDLPAARRMVEACRAAGVQFMVHENFRWQTPMRALKLASGELGELFYGRIHFRSGFDVYAEQPYLAQGERFILFDLGVHLLDLARFFFGEVGRLTCTTKRVNPRVRGEDVATLMLETEGGATCLVELSYASKLPEERFPQTLVELEGTHGSAILGPNYQLTVTTDEGTRRQNVSPRLRPWSTPPAEALQESVLSIQQHWLECLREGLEPETSGADNLNTLELVFAAYEVANRGRSYRRETVYE